MGDEASEDGCELKFTGFLSDYTEPTFVAYVAAKYTLPPPEVVELLDTLCAHAWRDQAGLFSPLPAGDRKAIHRIALHIRKLAADALLLSEPPHLDIRAVNAAVDQFIGQMSHVSQTETEIELPWSAIVLEQVFEIKPVPATALDLPEPLEALSAFIAVREQMISSEAMRERLQAIAALPVRPHLRRNKVRRYVLEEGLRACRSMWIQHSSVGWVNSGADYFAAMPEHGGVPPHNEGHSPGERFAADMLTAAGIRFEWEPFGAAWKSLNRRLRQGK